MFRVQGSGFRIRGLWVKGWWLDRAVQAVCVGAEALVTFFTPQTSQTFWHEGVCSAEGKTYPTESNFMLHAS